MNISAISVRKRVTFMMLFAFMLGVGIFGLTQLGLDLYPKLVFPQIMIFSQLNGAGPEEIENLVTEYIEKAAASTKNVTRVTSSSSPSLSLVTAEFSWGTDMDQAETDLRRYIDMYKSYLPDDASDPMVMVLDASLAPTMMIAFSSSRLDGFELRRIVEDEIEPLLRRVEGVGSVSVMGGSRRQINVIVNPVVMEQAGLSLGQVSGAVASVRQDTPAGEINVGGLNSSVKIAGSFDSLDDLAQLVVGYRPDGSPVLLEQIATIEDGIVEETGYVSLNGEPAVVSVVFRRSDANTVNVSDKLEIQLDQIREMYSDRVDVNLLYTQASFIEGSIGNLWTSALQALVLTVIVLLVFLRSWKSSSAVAISIPMSMIATFAVMYFADVNLNIISLAGLALAVGMLVDNSIVVLEVIVRRRESGEAPIPASINGATEVGMAITASTLTTVAVFIPILFVPGLAGQIFRDMSLTISFSLVVSLFVALTFIPIFTSRVKGIAGDGTENRLQTWLRIRMERIENSYKRGIEWALHHRKAVILSSVAMFAASLGLLAVVPIEFFSENDMGYISANTFRSPGTVLESTDSTATVIREGILGIVDSTDYEEFYMEVGQLEGFAAAFGSNSANNLNFFLTLVPRDQRSVSQQEYQDSIRAMLAEIPDLEATFSEGGPMSSSSPIEIRFYSEDLDALRDVTERCADVLETIPGTRDVETSMDIQRVQRTFIPDASALARFGVSRAAIGSEVSTGVMGEASGFYREGGSEYDIFLRYPEQYRDNVEEIMATPVAGRPLAAYGMMETGLIPQTISHVDQSRVATVSCSNHNRDLGSIANDVEKMLDTLDTGGLRYELAGQVDDQRETFFYLTIAIFAAALLVYMVMASQFESFLEPFIIIFTVPMAFIGVMFTLLITGTALSVTAMIGILMLAGIVVNNGIVLVDYANQLRGKGLGVLEAVAEAGRVRMRPIMMTALTTIFGMIPLALGIGDSGETWAPMARAVMGGLTVATFLTLFVLPCLYAIFGCRRKCEPDTAA
ncbi:MAG: efflux RND transporter permease subunit [Candidatus Fermentibacter sp.]|nr:efflux RND transporter permease subunit [Candidatus Fermentibacter sp.]